MSDRTTVPSPTATGGGGEHFEQHADAFALALLLVGGAPPVLLNTAVVEVCFQTRHLGWKTDDLLIIGETGSGVRRKLAAQVKRSFTISAADSDCCSTFAGFWDDYLATDRFDATADRFALITLHGTATLLQSFNSLLECARAAADPNDFSRRIALEGYLSRKAKQQNEAIKEILADHTGESPDDESYWRFLRTVNVVSFDLNTSSAQTEAAVLSLLAYSALDAPDPLATARATWARLLECAASGRPTAATYRRESLPTELLDRHTPVPSADSAGLRTLIEHGALVRESIRSTIGDSFEIDRSVHFASFLNDLEEHQVVVIAGAAGCGKSAMAKMLVAHLEKTRPVLAFQAVEFAAAHLDETLAKAQTTLNAQRVVAILAGRDRTTILIESVERLLEHSVRDALAQLLQIAKGNRAIQLVMTCRDYSVETVRSSFLASAGLPHCVCQVPPLSDDELQKTLEGVPNLAVPLQDGQLSSFLRTPYLLDMASRLDWGETHRPQNARAFRDKCWKELIRADQFAADGMPDRRETAFVEVAHRRATELRPFVRPTSTDAAALAALVDASVIERAPQAAGFYAPAHDVLEDWAIIRWLDIQFSAAGDPAALLAACVGGYPALRRGFRRWLSERFESEPIETKALVLEVIGRAELPSHFRDDCLVSALLSDSAGDFLDACTEKIAEGDERLLSQIVHLLRVACKESPRWLGVPGLPSQMLVPAGTGWAPAMRLVARQSDRVLVDNAALVLGLVEDWAKQIDWRNRSPDGAADAGRIVSALLPGFQDYGFEDLRKRTLEVILKIPSAVPEFRALLGRAEQRDHRDRVASDLADLLLGGLSGTYACQAYPAEVISFVNARLRMNESELGYDGHFSALEVNQVFGIREFGVSEFFPASALQGPFAALLQSHPQEAVTFVLDLLNHAGDWYGTQKWPGLQLEPASQIQINIPDSEPVQQWMNGRLYGLYRGMSVGPSALQSALMALEAWLLRVAEWESVDLESWLVYILRNSNNVMATAVVASVCIAHPDRAGKAGVALLSSRDLIQCDRSRMASESSGSLEVGFGLNPTNYLYEHERKQSNGLKHRREDLESLAVRMQFTERRDEVWRVIDHHRSELPEGDDESTLVWRLALHRMDTRGYKPLEVPEDKTVEGEEGKEVTTGVLLGPGEIEPDVQRMVDESSESQAVMNRHLGLLNRGIKAWSDRSSEEAIGWKQLLHEAQEIERELGEPEEFGRGGPGFVAAVCVRDRVEELDESELKWCAERIESEVRRDSEPGDDISRYQRSSLRPDRACACVVSILAARDPAFLELLALALTHPVDEVAAYANAGVGAFLQDEHKDLVLLCAGSAAYRARLIAMAREEEEKLPYSERAHGGELIDRATPAVRAAIVQGRLDTAAELTALDFDDWASSAPTRSILRILECHPDWEESRDFVASVATWLANVWERDRRRDSSHGRRDFELEHEARRIVAGFVLRVPVAEARRICRPFVEAAHAHAREVSDFVQDLILAADGGGDDCFWDLWQDFADKAVDAPWVGRLDTEHPYEGSFIDRIFLCTYWKKDVKHWERLEGNAHRIDRLAEQLPAVTCCLEAYSRFLYSIGQQSLPEALKVVASVLERGDAVRMASDSNIAFHLETRVQRFVYSEPHRLKSDPVLRDAVLTILDALIAGGSSSAYRMRDDFVTPLRQDPEGDASVSP